MVVTLLALTHPISAGTQPASVPTTGPVVSGSRAALYGNIAAAPASAPIEVKRAIWAANQLRTKPYRYGGGHRSFQESAYDCSGTVSYVLGAAIRLGMKRTTLQSRMRKLGITRPI
jgi:cell wall-associated NlpC family hydrolase